MGRFGVIVTVLLLAGLPPLARRILGPGRRQPVGRTLRVFCCVAILALIPALAIVEAFADDAAAGGYLRV